MNPDHPHVSQEQLIQLLWLAAPCPGVSESLLHLVQECDACYKPAHARTMRDSRHLDGTELETFGDRLFEEASKEAMASLVHLVGHCPTCQKASQGLLARLRQKLGVDWTSEAFEALADRLNRKVASWRFSAPQEKALAPDLGRQLLEHPPARRRLLINNSERFSTWPLVDWLCEASRQAVLQDPKDAIGIAETAVETAQSLDPERYGEALTADIIARAWAYLGNAHRVNENWTEAQVAFDTADTFQERGTRFGNVRAELLYLRSYVESAQQRFDQAHALLAEASTIYRELGDTHMEGRLRLIEATIFLDEAEPEAAVVALATAAENIDVEREPRLQFCAKQNLANALTDLDRFEEAEALMPSTFELAKSAGNRLDLLRLRWTQARIDSGLGRFARAEMALTDIKESFKGLGLPYDAALAGLELANLYSTQDRTREIKLLALELVPVFAKNELHREALVAITLFARAAAAEEATVEVVQTALAALKRAADRI